MEGTKIIFDVLLNIPRDGIITGYVPDDFGNPCAVVLWDEDNPSDDMPYGNDYADDIEDLTVQGAVDIIPINWLT